MKKFTLFILLSFVFTISSQTFIKAEIQDSTNLNSMNRDSDFDLGEMNLDQVAALSTANMNINEDPNKFKKTFLESAKETKDLILMALNMLWKDSKKKLYNDVDKELTCLEKAKLSLKFSQNLFKELNSALLTPAGKAIFAHLQKYKYEYLTAAIITIFLIKFKSKPTEIYLNINVQ